jgi:hypothetical protein
MSNYIEYFCFCIYNKKTNQKPSIKIFSQIEYDRTMSQVCNLKQKLLGKRVKNMETYYLTNAT